MAHASATSPRHCLPGAHCPATRHMTPSPAGPPAHCLPEAPLPPLHDAQPTGPLAHCLKISPKLIPKRPPADRALGSNRPMSPCSAHAHAACTCSMYMRDSVCVAHKAQGGIGRALARPRIFGGASQSSTAGSHGGHAPPVPAALDCIEEQPDRQDPALPVGAQHCTMYLWRFTSVSDPTPSRVQLQSTPPPTPAH